MSKPEILIRYTKFMTTYIAIDGSGGSGKTYLSEKLANETGAQLFHLDKYGSDFVPFIGLPVLRRLVDESTADIVIYEGVGVFDARFDDLEPYKIFVDTPEEIRASRVESRDVPREDRTPEDWKLITEIWTKAEQDYSLADAKQKAHLVVGSETGDFDVASIISEIRQHA